MSTLGLILLYFAIWLGVNMFIIAPILLELSLAKPRKTEDGKLRIKTDGFVLQYYCGSNMVFKKNEINIPLNLCQLYWRIVGGLMLYNLFILVISLLGYVIGIICQSIT